MREIFNKKVCYKIVKKLHTFALYLHFYLVIKFGNINIMIYLFIYIKKERAVEISNIYFASYKKKKEKKKL